MGIPSWAVPGARVVCIKVGRWANLDGDDDGIGPSFGQIVTIAEVEPAPPHLPEMQPSGINPVGYPGRMYHVGHFRPLAEDDIEGELYRALRPPAAPHRSLAAPHPKVGA